MAAPPPPLAARPPLLTSPRCLCAADASGQLLLACADATLRLYASAASAAPLRTIACAAPPLALLWLPHLPAALTLEPSPRGGVVASLYLHCWHAAAPRRLTPPCLRLPPAAGVRPGVWRAAPLPRGAACVQLPVRRLPLACAAAAGRTLALAGGGGALVFRLLRRGGCVEAQLLAALSLALVPRAVAICAGRLAVASAVEVLVVRMRRRSGGGRGVGRNEGREEERGGEEDWSLLEEGEEEEEEEEEERDWEDDSEEEEEWRGWEAEDEEEEGWEEGEEEEEWEEDDEGRSGDDDEWRRGHMGGAEQLLSLPSMPSALLRSAPFHDAWGSDMRARTLPTAAQQRRWMAQQRSPLLPAEDNAECGWEGWTRVAELGWREAEVSVGEEEDCARRVVIGSKPRLARLEWVFHERLDSCAGDGPDDGDELPAERGEACLLLLVCGRREALLFDLSGGQLPVAARPPIARYPLALTGAPCHACAVDASRALLLCLSASARQLQLWPLRSATPAAAELAAAAATLSAACAPPREAAPPALLASLPLPPIAREPLAAEATRGATPPGLGLLPMASGFVLLLPSSSSPSAAPPVAAPPQQLDAEARFSRRVCGEGGGATAASSAAAPQASVGTTLQWVECGDAREFAENLLQRAAAGASARAAPHSAPPLQPHAASEEALLLLLAALSSPPPGKGAAAAAHRTLRASLLWHAARRACLLHARALPLASAPPAASLALLLAGGAPPVALLRRLRAVPRLGLALLSLAPHRALAAPLRSRRRAPLFACEALALLATHAPPRLLAALFAPPLAAAPLPPAVAARALARGGAAALQLCVGAAGGEAEAEGAAVWRHVLLPLAAGGGAAPLLAAAGLAAEAPRGALLPALRRMVLAGELPLRVGGEPTRLGGALCAAAPHLWRGGVADAPLAAARLAAGAAAPLLAAALRRRAPRGEARRLTHALLAALLRPAAAAACGGEALGAAVGAEAAALAAECALPSHLPEWVEALLPLGAGGETSGAAVSVETLRRVCALLYSDAPRCNAKVRKLVRAAGESAWPALLLCERRVPPEWDASVPIPTPTVLKRRLARIQPAQSKLAFMADVHPPSSPVLSADAAAWGALVGALEQLAQDGDAAAPGVMRQALALLADEWDVHSFGCLVAPLTQLGPEEVAMLNRRNAASQAARQLCSALAPVLRCESELK
ncbi:hypothetical protein AB1Y20_016681 [Prymnesium parvum]|uniref:Uncharacterized protein n=1 Tax=Prymnesium parvum TaxID=97485 RepID=A0AB34IAV5_PRYPA